MMTGDDHDDALFWPAAFRPGLWACFGLHFPPFLAVHRCWSTLPWVVGPLTSYDVHHHTIRTADRQPLTKTTTVEQGKLQLGRL